MVRGDSHKLQLVGFRCDFRKRKCHLKGSAVVLQVLQRGSVINLWLCVLRKSKREQRDISKGGELAR